MPSSPRLTRSQPSAPRPPAQSNKQTSRPEKETSRRSDLIIDGSKRQRSSTSSQNRTSSNLRTCRTNSSNNRSAEEEQTVPDRPALSSCISRLGHQHRSRPSHPRNFWSQASDPPPKPGILTRSTSSLLLPTRPRPRKRKKTSQQKKAKTSSS